MKPAYQFNKTTDQNNINHYTEPISRHVAKDEHANQSYTKKNVVIIIGWFVERVI